MRSRRLYLATVLAFVAACTSAERGSSTGDVGGTLLIALPAEPGTLMPPLLSLAQDKVIADQVFDVLAEMGGPEINTLGDAGWKPRLAESWQWAVDSQSISFKLNPKARWHDGRAVTSADVRFSVDLYKDPKVQSQFADDLADVDSISTPDSLTAIAWYKRRSPEQFYNLVYSLLIVPEHLLKDADRANLGAHPFSRQPVGSGPFRFVRWDARSALEVAADTAYQLGRPSLDRVIWSLQTDAAAVMVNVLAGDVDMFETVGPPAIEQIAKQSMVKAVAHSGPNYGYLGFNFRDPKNPERPHALFADRNVRRALAMAIDRRLLLKNVYDSLAFLAYGPFSRAIATADTTIPEVAYDSAGADRLLDSLGWKGGNSDGVREKNGRPLAFGLLVPATSPGRKRYAELIQAQLRAHGVRVDVDLADAPLFGPRLMAGQFDAVINNLASDPSPAGIRNNWYSATVKNRSSNYQMYSNAAVDASIDSAIQSLDPERSRDYYRKAYRGIVDDIASVWLYENRPFMALNGRVKPVLAPNGWWRQLRLWSIPAAGRLPRDGM